MSKCNQPCRNTWSSPSITFQFQIKKASKNILLYEFFIIFDKSKYQNTSWFYSTTTNLKLWSYQNQLCTMWSLCNTKTTLCQILKLGTLLSFKLELKGFHTNFFSSLSSICWVVQSFCLPCTHTQCKLFQLGEFPRISQLLQSLLQFKTKHNTVVTFNRTVMICQQME